MKTQLLHVVVESRQESLKRSVSDVIKRPTADGEMLADVWTQFVEKLDAGVPPEGSKEAYTQMIDNTRTFLNEEKPKK